MSLVGILVLLAVVGFIAWLISLPGVPIASPFKQFILGVLVFVVLLCILQAYEIVGARDFGRIR